MQNLSKNNPVISKIFISRILPVFLLAGFLLNSVSVAAGLDNVLTAITKTSFGTKTTIVTITTGLVVAAYYAGASYVKNRYAEIALESRTQAAASVRKRALELAAQAQAQEEIRLAERANLQAELDAAAIALKTLSLEQLQELQRKLMAAIYHDDSDTNLRNSTAQVTRILAEYSTYINTADIYGLALIQTVKRIKNNRADIEECSAFGRSAVDIEYIANDTAVAIANLLIAAGANLEFETKYGETALRCTDNVCAKLLVEAVYTMAGNKSKTAARDKIMAELTNSENPCVRRVLKDYRG